MEYGETEKWHGYSTMGINVAVKIVRIFEMNENKNENEV